jgi:superfamily II DNA or RNA helicase
MTPWDHQIRGGDELDAALASGERRICMTSPTGGGKSYMMRERIVRARKRIAVYTNRRMLREQLCAGMEQHGIEHGVRASGVDPALLQDVQVCSIQTEERRVYRSGVWNLHDAEEVHIDECHGQCGGVATKIINDHLEGGAAIVGWTATPLDIWKVYQRLIVAGTNSELRKCGAHVPCQTYGPDEPDMRRFRTNTKTGEYTEGDVTKAIMTPTIFGRVFEWWKKLNPDARPAILFAPGVPESLWFAEQFCQRGVPAAHIDGDDIWINGKTMPSSQEARDELAEASKSGEVKVVCNRFVMREGIDWQWLYHCIMATVFGSVTSYLQSGGRLLRSYPSLDHVMLQDHGGNWWRHGSLNADREWLIGDTAPKVMDRRAEMFRQKQEKEPIVCPQCGKVRNGGQECRACGHISERQRRRVVQIDGTLRIAEGDIYKPRKTKEMPDTHKKWEACFWRAKKSKRRMTFNQAVGLFFHNHGYYPPRNLPLMPTRDSDWSRKVADVPFSDLIKKAQAVA